MGEEDKGTPHETKIQPSKAHENFALSEKAAVSMSTVVNDVVQPPPTSQRPPASSQPTSTPAASQPAITPNPQSVPTTANPPQPTPPAATSSDD